MNILTTMPYSAVILLLSFIIIAKVSAQDEEFEVELEEGTCEQQDFSTKEHKCPKGESEIYKEFAQNQYSKMCCTTGSKAEKGLKPYATTCRATECMRSTATNLCGTLYDRYVKGKKLDYEEVMRDACTLEDEDGIDSGIVALCCPKNSTESLLVTSMGAEPNEFPHQAKLKLPGNCGGTVYNKRFIITASHCIVDKENKTLDDATQMRVILGTNIADMESEEYVYNVTRAINHEKYSQLEGQPEVLKGGDLIYNDIALLELDRDITFSHKIKALEIAPKGFDPFKYADNAVIVGWGTMDNQALSVNLQKANFLLRSDQTCFQNTPDAPWSDATEYERQLLCVGGVRDGKWSPTAGGGDSGGPAICRAADGKVVLCGVTSYGGDDEKCAANKDEANCQSSVYAEVAHFHDWIKKHAGAQDPKTFYKPYLYGEPVPKGKYDHQVRITSKNGKSCGGTLVAPDIVVTAAQCVMAGDGKTSHSGLKVTHGLRDLKGGGGGKTYGIKGAAKHYTFAKKKKEVDPAKQGYRVIMADNYYEDDLAVIKLDGKVPVNPNKLPALPDFRDKFYRGNEIAFPRNTTISGQLRSRVFRLLDLEDCQRRLDRLSLVAKDTNVDKNLLCGVEKYNGASQCDRELGGGLICKKGDKEYLCGVQVFRLCEFTIPNGFLNMATYSGFVKKAMSQL